MKTLIIIPTYNECENIKKLIYEIKNMLNGIDYSILVVDDNSDDGTKDVLEEMKYEPNLFIMGREGKLGLASAYIEGFKYGIFKEFDFLIQMDADFSHSPIYLIDIIENLKRYDVVIASRNIDGGKVIGWSFLRNLISKGGSIYSKIVLNCPINDLTGGFNGWRREIIEKIDLDSIISVGYSFQIEMKYKAYQNNAKIKELPITFEDRKFGRSKMNLGIFLEALINIFKIRFMK